MHIEAKPGDFWVTITGSATELMEARRKLEGWSKDLDPTGSGRAMCLERAGALRVPAGAVLQLQECQPVIGVPERATVAEHASKLRVAGLLRDYQARAVTAALCAPLGRGTLDMACGAGKTRVSAALAAVAQAATGRGSWLYLVKNNELARQSEREFVEVLQKMADVLQSCLSHNRSPEPAVIVATTYSGIGKLVKKEFDGVIIDECHELTPITRCVPFATVKALWRVGMSGTLLDRQDANNALTLALLGPPLCKISIAELEREGHLSRGRVQILKFDHRMNRLV